MQRPKQTISPQRTNMTFQGSNSSTVSLTKNRSSQGLQSYYQSPSFNQNNRISTISSSSQSPLSKAQQQQQANNQQENNNRQRLPKTRPQEAFYKRINDVEKKAKTLDQEREEQLDQFDLNDFFKDPKMEPQSAKEPVFQRQVSSFNDNLSSNSMDNSRYGNQSNHLNRLPQLPREALDINENEIKYLTNFITGDKGQGGQGESFEQNGFFNYNLSDNKKSNKIDEQPVYIAPESALNDEILNFYGISRNNKDPMDGVNKSYRGLISKNNQFKAIIDDQFERLDSRGKRIKIRRVHVHQEVMGEIGYPFSTMNFHPLTYITQHELKARANSLAYAKYKLVKRENAKKAAKRKLLLIMCIVKCKSFVNKLKARVQIRRAEKKKIEEEQRRKENRRKNIKEQQRLMERSSIADETQSSRNTEQVSGLMLSESNGSLLRFGSALNTSSNFGILKNEQKRTESVNFQRAETVNVNEAVSSQISTGILSPSFTRQNIRPPSTSTSNTIERDEYLKSKITVEKFD
ncbi:UNKNOWN [Stylonychia lemnae]|uniref:Uncharacterized protein n=1 Tax=Stylonychia lemnae TaxID=5949 RepID=A0A078A5F4_STYLE|nr:UNKNOWN [Stylonychia lemnae]|eukprot:CDW77124.1 UNKNOWN [Stylonychia lemnae]